jgi:Bacterial regulatory helix-turn-helix protein, lysR family
MGNGKIRSRLQNDRLRCHAARPKYRDFVGPNGHRIAVVRPRDVADADLSGIAKVHRRAVHCGKTSGDLDCADRVCRVEWSHRHDEWTGEQPGRRARHIGAIHRHVATLLDVTNREAVGHQGMLERKRTANHEGDEVVAPMRHDVGRLFDEFAVAPDAVTRQVGANAFVEVAEHGSFTKAATHLRVTKGSLSHTIRALEQSLGVRLLNRTTRSVALTEAGERMLTRLRPVLDDFEAVVDSANAFRDRPAGQLRLTVPPGVTTYLIGPLLARFLAQYPEIESV